MRLGMAALAALACCGASASEAQEAPAGRTKTVVVYGNDPCPNSSDSEVVVCARRPENERYRIPKELRKTVERPLEASWGSRVAGVEDAARAERPNSCSPVGTGGQTGCRQQQLRDWYAARRAARNAKDSEP